MRKRFLLIVFAAVVVPVWCPAQPFSFGNDLSYVNQMEDCGAVFKDDGTPKDVYQLFADRGTNLVRVRLWVDPSWWQSPLPQPDGVKPFYSDLEDVKETIRRSQEAGMRVMLDMHYSDFWADPGRQLIPRRWLDVAHDLEVLEDSVYQYTTDVLTALDAEGLMPELVKIGNENNGGILRHVPEEGGFEPAESVSTSWARHAQLYNAAIQAVRDVGAAASIDPKIAVHFSNGLPGMAWNFQNLLDHGVTDFDVMGLSYYYAWHQGSIDELEDTVRDLVDRFPEYEIAVVETGYLWTRRNFDSLGNIISTPDPEYLPVIPEKQLEYMVDYTRAVMRGGGTGVIFWEPAWVSTPCRTPWGQGSSHDHVVFFDPENTDFIENGGGRWMERHFYDDLDAHKVAFEVDMSGRDVSEGVYVTGTFTGEDWELRPMADEGDGIFSYFTYLPEGATGAFYFLNANDWEARETVPAACAEEGGTDRGYEVADGDTVFAVQWGSCEAIGTSTGEMDDATLPRRFELRPNYPNPFNPSTTISFALPRAAHVTVQVFDALGRPVTTLVDERKTAGTHRVPFEASGLPSGVYLYRLEAGAFTDTRTLTFIR